MSPPSGSRKNRSGNPGVGTDTFFLSSRLMNAFGVSRGDQTSQTRDGVLRGGAGSKTIQGQSPRAGDLNEISLDCQGWVSCPLFNRLAAGVCVDLSTGPLLFIFYFISLTELTKETCLFCVGDGVWDVVPWHVSISSLLLSPYTLTPLIQTPLELM